VLMRHYPELAKALDGVDNAFVPWKTSMATKGTVPTNPGGRRLRADTGGLSRTD
jgi:hypothetical protein